MGEWFSARKCPCARFATTAAALALGFAFCAATHVACRADVKEMLRPILWLMIFKPNPYTSAYTIIIWIQLNGCYKICAQLVLVRSENWYTTGCQHLPTIFHWYTSNSKGVWPSPIISSKIVAACVPPAGRCHEAFHGEFSDQLHWTILLGFKSDLGIICHMYTTLSIQHAFINDVLPPASTNQ